MIEFGCIIVVLRCMMVILITVVGLIGIDAVCLVRLRLGHCVDLGTYWFV